jgi:hypothetical protein
MARSRRKNGGPARDTFKKKRLGKGWAKNRRVPSPGRPVLRVTETDAAEPKKG